MTGTTISSTVFNAFTADIATGLSTAICKDGQTTVSAGIPFYAGTVSLPGVTFVNDLNTGLYWIGADNIGVAAGGAKVLDVSGTGLAITGLADISAASSGQIKFPTTQNASSNVYTLDDYFEEAGLLTLTGCTTSPIGAIQATKIGNQVTIDVVAFTGTSNATTKTLTGLSSRFRPTTTKYGLYGAMDNGTPYVCGLFTVNSSGVVTLYPTISTAGSWTSSGTFSSQPFSFSYTKT